MTGSFERIEVITGVERRRRWSVEEKRRIVAESVTAGVSVSAVARRHGLGPNQLFRWRKLAREGAFGPGRDGAASFVPVRIAGDGASVWPVAATSAGGSERPSGGSGGASGLPVEIVLTNGCRLRVAAEIETSALHRLVTTLKAAGG